MGMPDAVCEWCGSSAQWFAYSRLGALPHAPMRFNIWPHKTRLVLHRASITRLMRRATSRLCALLSRLHIVAGVCGCHREQAVCTYDNRKENSRPRVGESCVIGVAAAGHEISTRPFRMYIE